MFFSHSSQALTDPESPEAQDHLRIMGSLRQAALERNLKTVLILGAGASGALISLPWFAATAAGTTLAISIARYRQETKNKSKR